MTDTETERVARAIAGARHGGAGELEPTPLDYLGAGAAIAAMRTAWHDQAMNICYSAVERACSVFRETKTPAAAKIRESAITIAYKEFKAAEAAGPWADTGP